MANSGVKRGVGMTNPLPSIPGSYGAVLLKDPTAEGGVRWQPPTALVPNQPGMSFLSTANGLPIGAPANTRRSCQILNDASSLGTSTSNQDSNVRMAFKLPVNVTRFRLKWDNYSNSITAGQNGAVAITGVWIGLANIAAATAWQGDFTAAPTLIGAAAVVGSAGTVATYTTPWIAASQVPSFVAGALMAVSIGINTAVSGPAGVNTGLNSGGSGAFMCNGSNCSLAANAGAAAWNAAAGTNHYNNPLGDLRMEFEYVGSNPIGLWVGDSLMAGWKGSNAVDPVSAPGPYCRYPEMVGNRLGHLVENVAAGGKSLTSGFTDDQVGNGTFPSTHYYNRLWFDGPAASSQLPTIPDYAVIELGTNDMNRYENTTLIKTQFQQLVQTLKVGIGIPKVFALTVPPPPDLASEGHWARVLHTGTTGASSTTLITETVSPDPFLITIDTGNTTVNQVVVVNSTNFTGSQTLTLTAVTNFNTAGGYAQVGGAGGCIIRYTGVSGLTLTGVLFIVGAAVTTVAGTTACVGANMLGIEQGGDDNTIFELVYATAISNGATTTSGNMTFTLGAGQKVANTHVAGCTVMGAQECQRQRFNAWLRNQPPGIDGVIDIAMNLEYPLFSPNPNASTSAAEFGASVHGLNNSHPYHYALGSSNFHPRSPAWHTAIASMIAPHLIGV